MDSEWRENSKKSLKYITTFIVINIFNVKGIEKNINLIYILLWTSSDNVPFRFLAMEQESFITRKCDYQNCFITNNRVLFNDVTKFDVIMFNVINLGLTVQALPSNRSMHQWYVFVSLYPPGYHQISGGFNGFFNLTWTYKLPSDIPFTHILVKNEHGNTIGPKLDMHWIDVKAMKHTSRYVIDKLRKKKTAAMWIVSNCSAKSNRFSFVEALQRQLDKYNHKIDIFGRCGNKECSNGEELEECFALLESDYYFYLAFENSLSEDYVTEKVCHALEHFAVPVVFGGANYTRFMPNGIYLNARILEPEALAYQMNNLIKYKDKYIDFFRWRSYYSFHETSHENYNDEICTLCAFLNNVTQGNKTNVYMDIYQWWNGSPDVARWADEVEIVTEPIVQTNNLFVVARNMFNDIYYAVSQLI